MVYKYGLANDLYLLNILEISILIIQLSSFYIAFFKTGSLLKAVVSILTDKRVDKRVDRSKSKGKREKRKERMFLVSLFQSLRPLDEKL